MDSAKAVEVDAGAGSIVGKFGLERDCMSCLVKSVPKPSLGYETWEDWLTFSPSVDLRPNDPIQSSQ